MTYYTREQWGAKPPKNRPVHMPDSAVEAIFIHYNGPAISLIGFKLMQGIQRYHQSREFNDFAYSAGVDNAGDRFEGRGRNVQDGATSPSWAGRSYSIFVGIGGNQAPKLRTLKAIKAQVRDFRSTTPRYLPVLPHKAAYSTSCPGDFLSGWIRDGMPVDSDGKDSGKVKFGRPKMPGIGRAVMSRGDKRNVLPWRRRRVHAMQRALSYLGYDIVGTGPWGPVTERAIYKFQVDNGLRSSGTAGSDSLVGAITYNALRKAVKSR